MKYDIQLEFARALHKVMKTTIPPALQQKVDVILRQADERWIRKPDAKQQ